MIRNPLPSYFPKQFFILALVLLIPSYVAAYEAPIEYIPARSYFETALQEISQAQKSIKVYMFVISAKLGEPESKVMRLLDALVAAKGRGVAVEVHLDQNYPYGSEGADKEVDVKNDNAYRYLKEHGITVYVDDPSDYAHAKAVVIDDKVTVFGSSNWSRSALDINDETNAVVRSEQFAGEVLKDLSGIESLMPDLPEEIKTIRIPKAFTTRDDLMGRMVTSTDERTFDIYLYLLKEFDGNAEGKVKVNYDDLAKHLGIDNMSREDYRRKITRVLRKLQDDYKLIIVNLKFSAPADVVLKDHAIPQDEIIHFPEDYWNFGWGKRLSFPAKVVLLLNWEYSQGTLTSWRSPVNDLMAKHHISKTFIGDGVKELRRLNLIEARYEELSREPGIMRRRVIYTPNQLYDPEKLEKRFAELAEKFGKEEVNHARGYAKAVYKDYDYEDVLTLIGLEKQYGQEILQEAAKILESKGPTNPKRHFGYLVGTVKGLAGKQALIKE